MSSSVQRKRIRKSPEARRAEIVDTAAAVALSEGLECLTLRRIADELDVRPGLISHYFPSVEDLVAEAFGTAAGAELEVLLPLGADGPAADGPAADGPAGDGPAGDEQAGDGPAAGARLTRFFARTSGEAYDAVETGSGSTPVTSAATGPSCATGSPSRRARGAAAWKA